MTPPPPGPPRPPAPCSPCHAHAARPRQHWTPPPPAAAGAVWVAFAVAVVASQTLFREWDADGSGVLDMRELYQVITRFNDEERCVACPAKGGGGAHRTGAGPGAASAGGHRRWTGRRPKGTGTGAVPRRAVRGLARQSGQ